MTYKKEDSAIILLSGGLDSSTVLYFAINNGYKKIYAISFIYGQRHHIEIMYAQKIAKSLKENIIEHKLINIDLGSFGGSALVDSNIQIPDSRFSDNENNYADFIPVTYVPARNTIFLSYALAYAEVKNIHNIFIGVNAVDYSGYPDCRPDYISKFQELANLATYIGTNDSSDHSSDEKYNKESETENFNSKDLNNKFNNSKKIKILTPLINLTKAQIIEMGLELGVDYSMTISCYNPHYYNKNDSFLNKFFNKKNKHNIENISNNDDICISCGKCDACVLRLNGFSKNGIEDPILYQ
ncbi:7-cyano-7-deazaguanine synthase [Lyticum sinuosum]|uniref:7-cyano-7-deazaguanine synthase n=1 Tax=Lyticum sinuosum TaxID=1332059 RepID=A0AAE4VJK5_9RICK|nr:7-cyano-7-deazaguanine synthase [Lyticum sinuosum]MDZ5761016.1 7-cyano-7-deazaguanine synthase [Lyticum sinuosum]